MNYLSHYGMSLCYKKRTGACTEPLSFLDRMYIKTILQAVNYPTMCQMQKGSNMVHIMQYNGDLMQEEKNAPKL